MADNAQYGLDTNRMGVIVYGNEAYKEIDLNEYSTVESFKTAVGAIGYLDQSTNTASPANLKASPPCLEINRRINAKY